MRMLNFYKVYNWMIYEFGAGDPALIAYALLYSYYENGRPCKISLSSVASVLRCSRRQAIRVIMRLDAEGYINTDRNGRKTNIYEIAVEKAVEMQQNFLTSDTDDTSTSDTDDTSLVTRMTLASDMYDTRTSDTDVTLIENNRDFKREDKRECVRASSGRDTRTAADEQKSSYGANGLVKLTDSEYQQLRELNYAYGRTLDSYLESMEQQINKGKKYRSHFIALRSWITADEKKSHEESSLAFRYDADGNERGHEDEWESVYNPSTGKREYKRKLRFQ